MPYVPRHVEPLTLCKELALFAQAAGLGTFGSSIRLSALPDTPYVCQAVIPQPGPRVPGSPLDFVRVQWLVRDINVTSASALAQQVFQVISDRKPDLPSFAGFITLESGPVPFKDANNLEVSSLNFLFTGMVRVI